MGPRCPPTAAPWPCCSTPGWTAAWCRLAGSAGRRGLLGPGAALGRHLAAGGGRRGGAGPAPQPAPDPARRRPVQPAAPPPGPAGPVRDCRPRTWSATRPGSSSTPVGASNGPSRWSGCCGPLLVAPAGRRGRGPPARVAPQDVGEPDHLPAALGPDHARGRCGRPARVRRGQPPQRDVPARPAVRPPGRSAQAVAGPATR